MVVGDVEPKVEITFTDNVWSELVGQTTSSSPYRSVTIAKTISLKLYLEVFLFTSTTPITEVLHDPETSVNNNEFISAVLSYSILHILTSLGRVP